MTRILRLLPWLLILAALLLPVGLWLARHVPPRPDLRWAVIDWNLPAPSSPDIAHESYGVTIQLDNRGSAPVGEIRMVLPPDPVDIETVLPDGVAWSETAEGDRAILTLGPLPAGTRADLRWWGASEPLEVTADGERVSRGSVERAGFREDPWLPNWAVLSGALLLAGLALQNLRLRRELEVRG